MDTAAAFWVGTLRFERCVLEEKRLREGEIRVNIGCMFEDHKALCPPTNLYQIKLTGYELGFPAGVYYSGTRPQGVSVAPRRLGQAQQSIKQLISIVTNLHVNEIV